jgi:hypothetical protein
MNVGLRALHSRRLHYFSTAAQLWSIGISSPFSERSLCLRTTKRRTRNRDRGALSEVPSISFMTSLLHDFALLESRPQLEQRLSSGTDAA